MTHVGIEKGNQYRSYRHQKIIRKYHEQFCSSECGNYVKWTNYWKTQAPRALPGIRASTAVVVQWPWVSTRWAVHLKGGLCCILWASLAARTVNNLPGIQETRFDLWVRKIPLEKGMATHSATLAWRTPWMEEPGKLQVHGVADSPAQLSN